MIFIHNEIVLLFQRFKNSSHGVDTIGIITPFKNFVVKKYHVETFSLVLFILV